MRWYTWLGLDVYYAVEKPCCAKWISQIRTIACRESEWANREEEKRTVHEGQWPWFDEVRRRLSNVCVQQHSEHPNNNKLNYRLRGTTHCVLLCSKTTQKCRTSSSFTLRSLFDSAGRFSIPSVFPVKNILYARLTSVAAYRHYFIVSFVMQKPNQLSLIGPGLRTPSKLWKHTQNCTKETPKCVWRSQRTILRIEFMQTNERCAREMQKTNFQK